MNKKPRPESRKKAEQYKVKNWPAYNEALKRRGDITLWIAGEIEDYWYYEGENQVGGQFIYSDAAIMTALTVRSVYHLRYRQTEGFLESLMKLMGKQVEVPCYTQLCRRAKNLFVALEAKRRSGNIHIVIDSSGLKVYGEGEWKVRQHGYSKRRTWRKIHIGLNAETGEVEAVELTGNHIDDAQMTAPLIEGTDGKIKTLRGDGGYDKMKVYRVLDKRKIRGIIPPRKDARILQHGNRTGKPFSRDEILRAIRRHGRKKWKKMSGYHKRSKVENFFFRYKTIFGDQLSSRKIENQKTEVRIACNILNKMTSLGMPDTRRVREAA